MPEKNKKMIPFSKAISIIVVFALVAFGGVFVYKYWPQPETVQEPADETAGWQIYRNEDWGFEIKYFSDMTLREVQAAEGGLGFIEIVKGRSANFQLSIIRKKNIVCGDRTTWATPCDYLCEQMGGENEKNIEIDGAPAMFVSKYESWNKDNFGYRAFVCVDSIPSVQFSFTIMNPSNNEEVEGKLTLLEQMLSTFKFINSNN